MAETTVLENEKEKEMTLIDTKHVTATPELKVYFRDDSLRCRVFLDKYALRDEKGRVVEKLPQEMWRRVAKTMASVEKTDELKKEWEEKFYWLLEDFRSIPGGRILFGAGNNRRVTLLNCYVVPVTEDSIEGVFNWCKEAARTYSLGGGVGTDISLLRPKGASVNNAAVTSSGAVSFMDLFSVTTGTIGQAGRRGALMLTMRDSHPDILDFCRIKRNLRTVRYANISVLVSDTLMKAVQTGDTFNLVYKTDKTEMNRTISARELWDELATGARDWAEPGIIFWDTIKRESTSEYNGMEVISTNPCSEIPLEGYGDCCLGNINLAKFVKNEFQESACIDWDNMEKALRYMVRFLDNVLEYNCERHPLKQQGDASMRSRRIGVGFTGLGDMLCMMRLTYGTDESISFTDKLFERIKHIVYDQSIELGIEKGVFPEYDQEKHFKSPYIQRLSPEIREKIKKHGLRNVALLTVPPVGSGALLAGVTSGIEPIFDLFYVRRSESLTQEFFKVYHPLVGEYMRSHHIMDDSELPDYFVTAHKIEPEKRIAMQAAIQQHIDHAISSTINLHREATVDDVKKIYTLAWKSGCKGMTVYREGSREGVLITEEEVKRKAREAKLSSSVTEEPMPAARTRPKVTEGRTERVETPRGPIYVTVNGDEMGLCEVFVKSLDAEAEVTGRLVSLLLRAEVDPRDILEQLWRVRSREVAFDRSTDGTTVRVSTVSQGVALSLGRYLYGDSFNPGKEFPRMATLPEPVKKPLQKTFHFGHPVPALKENVQESGNGKTKKAAAMGMPDEFAGICPDCGEILRHENGCAACKTCGYSKCG